MSPLIKLRTPVTPVINAVQRLLDLTRITRMWNPVYPDWHKWNTCIICTKVKHEDQCKPLTCHTCQGAHHTWLHLG